MRVDGSIKIGTKIDTKGFNKGRSKIESGMKSLSGSIKRLGVVAGLALGTAAVVGFGRASVKAASDLADAMVGLESIMDGQGRSFKDAQKFINAYTSDGLLPATQAIAAYKNLALRGYDDTQIQRVLIALKDSATFGRQSSLTLGEAVRSATEGLKNENSILVDNAGVTKNVAKMWADYAKSIGTSAQALTQQQKIQAEVNGILEETKYQTGDAAKVAGTYSGKMLGLSFAVYNLKVAFGNALIPMLSAIIPHIANAINWLTRLVNIFAKVMSTIFGGKAKGAVKDKKAYAGATKDAAKAEEGLAKQAGGVGKALKQTNKEMANTLAGFDELNVLASQDLSPGGGGAGGAGGGGGADITMPEIESGGEILGGLDIKEETIGKFKALGDVLKPFDAIKFDNLSASFGRLKEAMSPFGKILFDGLKWGVDNVLAPLTKFVIEEVLPRFLDTLAAALGILVGVISGLQPIAGWFFDNFLAPLASFTADVALVTWDLIIAALTRMSDWMQKHPKTVQVITGVIAAFFGAWQITKVLAFVEMSGGIIKAFKLIKDAIIGATIAKVVDRIETMYLTALYAKDFLISLGKSTIAIAKQGAALVIATGQKIAHAAAQLALNIAQGAWNVIAGIGAGVTMALGAAFAFLTSPIGIVILAIAALIAIVILIVKHWDEIKAKAIEVWDRIVEVWHKVADWFTEHVVEPIKAVFAGLPDKIKEIFIKAFEFMITPYLFVFEWFRAHVFDKIIDALSGVPAKAKEIFAAAWERIKEAFGKVRSWFESHVAKPIKDTFKGAFNAVIDFINDFLRGAAKGINFVVEGLNEILSVELPGGGKLGVSIPKIPAPKGIPRLATGAVIPPNAEFLAVLGDQKHGRNIEAPEGLIRDIVRSELEDLPQPDINITATGSMAQMVRLLKFEIDRESKRKGKSLVLGGANG